MSETVDNEPLDLEHLVFEAGQAVISPKIAARILPMMEPTSLKSDTSIDDIIELCKNAETPGGNVAAVCVLPRFVETAFDALRHNTIKIATVVNFPAGTDTPQHIANITEDVVNAGAQEVSVVFPYTAFLDDDFDHVNAVLKACREACGPKTLMKVILETSVLGSKENIQNATYMAITADADFIKTSTGVLQQSTSLDVAAYVLEALYEYQLKHPDASRVGLKVSGGLKSANAAAQFLKLTDLIMGDDWADEYTMRFIGDCLLDEILETLGEPAHHDDTEITHR